jgi:hypothetical protein
MKGDWIDMATLPQLAQHEEMEWPRETPAPVERRSGSRVQTVMRVARVTRAQDSGLWRVRNISDEGLMLMSGQRVRVGESLIVGLSDTFVVGARVAWAEDGRCGCQFNTPIDCAAVLKSLAAEQRGPAYRMPRLAVETLAVLTGENGVSAIKVTDVAQDGVGFNHDGSVRADQAAKIVFPNGGEYRGVVRWSADGRAGMHLFERIPLALLESARAL